METSQSSCVFCNIVAGKESQEILYQDDRYTAFNDIRPASTHHILIVTNEHIRDVKHLKGRTQIIDDMVKLAGQITTRDAVKEDEVRLGFHVPPMISVYHIHLHVIWPWSQTPYLLKLKYIHHVPWFWTPERAKKWLEQYES